MPVVGVAAIARPEQLDDMDTALCHEGADLLAVDRVDAARRYEIERLAELVPAISRAVIGVHRADRVGNPRTEGASDEGRDVRH